MRKVPLPIGTCAEEGHGSGVARVGLLTLVARLHRDTLDQRSRVHLDLEAVDVAVLQVVDLWTSGTGDEERYWRTGVHLFTGVPRKVEFATSWMNSGSIVSY